MQTLYQTLKILHILAFIIGIGVTFANLIAYSQLFKVYEQDRSRGVAVFNIIQVFFKAGGFSMIVLILAGLGMLAIADWSYTQILWFQIKLGLIVLIFVNGLTLGRTSAGKVHALIQDKNSTPNPVELASIQSRTRRFFTLQLLIFLAIVIVSVFRFT
jgi:hypothetical protein